MSIITTKIRLLPLMEAQTIAMKEELLCPKIGL